MRTTGLFVLLSLVYAGSAIAEPKGPGTQPSFDEHSASGWRFRLPSNWTKPKDYAEETWNQKGIAHRVRKDTDPKAIFTPMLIWWGDEIRPGQKIEEVVALTAEHHGSAKGLTLGQVKDVKIAGFPGKKVEATFQRTVAFAPPGQNPRGMKAVLYLIRENGQENGLWYEAAVDEFEVNLKDVETMVATAETFKRTVSK